MSWWHYRTGFGIALAKHCNLVFCSFVLRIDWWKPFLTVHAVTCGVNGLNNFMCLWCNTTIVAIGRKVRFHHTRPFMTKQRCSSFAATSRQHQNCHFWSLRNKNFSCRSWDVFWIIFGRWIRIWRLVSPAVSIFQDIYNIIYIFL